MEEAGCLRGQILRPLTPGTAAAFPVQAGNTGHKREFSSQGVDTGLSSRHITGV